jgi:uridine kinase
MNIAIPPPFVIGVAGGSGSGKSTVTREVLASIGPEMATVVMQDDYYLDQTHLSPEERRKTNYDHPQAFDWLLMVQHVQALLLVQPAPPRQCAPARPN